MQRFLLQHATEIPGSMIPLAILLIENDGERDFLSEMYLQYRALMYKTAIDFFGKGSDEVEDAVSASVERMCKYCHAFQAIECNKRASYLVLLVGNVCRDRLREAARRRTVCDDSFSDEEIEQMTGADDVYETIFDRAYAVELLDSFEALSERERDLILMRHVDMMEYSEMAAALNMQEGAIRTVLSRAKKHLESLATASKEGKRDEKR